jgi:hypothetical protein
MFGARCCGETLVSPGGRDGFREPHPSVWCSKRSVGDCLRTAAIAKAVSIIPKKLIRAARAGKTGLEDLRALADNALADLTTRRSA